ncbi:MAG TPA: hypothetical protein QF508_01485 [Candidatus Thalassarchaeaceae archaeon]|jgi:hypothetical protein|nr:hypothetical protein [Candidatus Thalassarchaeaceae archaeon]MDP7658790.1 hypothetical protein [Candidatus Thalassarchaeaceae archaeon]HJO42060.1 hypothetical protein [Candidatus Thalassarchaeaceae archaeon]|tara:strand:+ start:55 stop:693 length:639 start_codon:yes stop_codon:yes gene_type:complete
MNDEIPVDIDHIQHSVGGAGGHWFRRITHVSMFLIPLAYHLYGVEIANMVNLEPRDFVIAVGIAFVIIEAIRINFGIIIVGQREYEANQVSALAWGAIAVCLTLIIAPQEGEGLEAGKFTIPIICGLTFVDPLMGEVKRAKMGMKKAIVAGMVASYIIWLGCSVLFSTPILYAIILAPLTVLGEIPRVKWIDDNATMILFPLILLLIMKAIV